MHLIGAVMTVVLIYFVVKATAREIADQVIRELLRRRGELRDPPVVPPPLPKPKPPSFRDMLKPLHPTD